MSNSNPPKVMQLKAVSTINAFGQLSFKDSIEKYSHSHKKLHISNIFIALCYLCLHHNAMEVQSDDRYEGEERRLALC